MKFLGLKLFRHSTDRDKPMNMDKFFSSFVYYIYFTSDNRQIYKQELSNKTTKIPYLTKYPFEVNVLAGPPFSTRWLGTVSNRERYL